MKNPRVLVTRPILDAPLQRLHDRAQVRVACAGDSPLSAEQLKEEVVGADAVLCHLTDRVDKAVLAAAGSQLKVVANYAVGFDNIDLDACRAAGVYATNTPDVLSESTADLAFALMLAVSRRLIEGDHLVRSGAWAGWAPRQLLGGDLNQRTLGIVGCGRIGQALARRARGFGLRCLYWQPQPLAAEKEKMWDVDYAPFECLLRQSDYVSLHCPFNRQTHHLIGAKELALMQTTAYLINTSRGPVVDEAALVKALSAGEIAGAGLDVYEKEPVLTNGLAALDNVVLLPHLGSATVATRARMAEVAIDNIVTALEGKKPPNALC